jgi:hypothetical protein
VCAAAAENQGVVASRGNVEKLWTELQNRLSRLDKTALRCPARAFSALRQKMPVKLGKTALKPAISNGSIQNSPFTGLKFAPF